MFAAGALFALAACEEGGDFALPAPDDHPPLQKAEMMAGRVILVPPHGYCIDSHSLKPRFAVMARCDALSDEAGTGGAPVGMISVSFAVLPDGNPLPGSQDLAAAYGLKNPRDVSQTAKRISFRAEGAPAAKGYAPTQWRGVARLGSVMMGLSLHGPDKGRAISTEGRDMLHDLITRTRQTTRAAGS